MVDLPCQLDWSEDQLGHDEAHSGCFKRGLMEGDNHLECGHFPPVGQGLGKKRRDSKIVSGVLTFISSLLPGLL